MNGRSAVRPWRRQRAADRHRALRPIQSRCLPGFPFQVFTAISALIFSGVLDRFPRLKLGFFEVGIGWIPWLLDRLEMAYDARPAAREKAGRRPKECFNNFYLSLGSEDSTLADVVKRIGSSRLMIGSDFPHPDGTSPNAADSGRLDQKRY